MTSGYHRRNVVTDTLHFFTVDIKFVRVEYCYLFIGILFVPVFIFALISYVQFSYIVVSAVVFAHEISSALQIIWMTQKTCPCTVHNGHRLMCKTYVVDTLGPSYQRHIMFGVVYILVHTVFYEWHWEIWFLCQLCISLYNISVLFHNVWVIQRI